MSERAEMFELRRNPQICSGERSCGVCGDHMGSLRHSGRVQMAGWAVKHNEKAIDQAIRDCPVGALELVQI